MLLAFKLGQVILVKVSSPSCFTLSFDLFLTCSKAIAGTLWGWFCLAETIWPFVCSSTTSCTNKGSRAVHGLGGVAAVQILQPGQCCWLIEEVPAVHFNSFQLGGKLLYHSLSSKTILPHDALTLQESVLTLHFECF